MVTECWLGLLMGSDGSSTLWEGAYAPHCGSRGFEYDDNSGGETEAGNIEYICM